MGAYVNTGPFVNGSAPGIAAAFLNNIETFIQQFQGNTGSVSVSGSTSGTATLYQVVQGTFKIAYVQMNNYRQGAAGALTLTLPVAFTKAHRGFSGGCGAFQLLLSASAQTVQQLTGFNAGADNTVSPQTTLHQNWTWHCSTGFDTISLNGSDASTHNDQIVIIGI